MRPCSATMRGIHFHSQESYWWTLLPPEFVACMVFICMTDMCNNVLAAFFGWVKINSCVHYKIIMWKKNHIWCPFAVLYCNTLWSRWTPAYWNPLMYEHYSVKCGASLTEVRMCFRCISQQHDGSLWIPETSIHDPKNEIGGLPITLSISGWP